ncbi:MAG: HEAT repeat domain-containing protein [Chloroflexi bacterium]|nr:HEAT repeat domain-containing protein [Chloroflexota bacterium]
MADEFKYESTHYPHLNAMTLPELMAYFQAEHLDEEGNEDWWAYEDTALLIRKLGSSIGIQFLLETYKTIESTAQKRAILLALTYRPALDMPQVHDLLLKSLDDPDDTIIMDAIDDFRHLERFDLLDRVMTFKSHPSPYVRAAVLRFIGRLFPIQAVPMLIEAIHDPHFIPREEVADTIGEMDMEDDEKRQLFLPYLQILLTDEHPDVQEAAETAIAFIEGTY